MRKNSYKKRELILNDILKQDKEISKLPNNEKKSSVIFGRFYIVAQQLRFQECIKVPQEFNSMITVS